MAATGGGTGGSHASHSIESNAPLLLHAMTAENKSEEHADDHDHADGEDHGHEHADGDHAHGDDHHEAGHGMDHGPDPSKFDRDIGTFFSIYYCMTGLHAIHIIAGIIALAWLYWRSLAAHWRPDYFGPVDFVGLYWHLVDLIWIYLFPLLYLIE
jgi:cytochrome c oxidase subunit 3